MKAIAYQTAHALTAEVGLQDIDLPVPRPEGRELLIEVQAVSVNPVDTKIRNGVNAPDGAWKVLGWDATGVVTAVGPQVSLFKVGDRVWYAGDISRQGSNAQYQTVDERIVGRMPSSLDFAAAAALPLTAITAWEMLFDRLQIARSPTPSGQQLLIIGAAGGVGSVMIQLARQLTGLTIIATASRPETQQWVQDLGAHHVIDHRLPLSEELQRIGIPQVTHIVSLNQTEQHLPQILESIAPQGHFGLIDDPRVLDVMPFKRKSVAIHWELMFTRSLYQTADMIEQHHLLNAVADLIDQGVLRTTVNEQFGVINAENLRRAHALLESGRAQGKIVLAGF
ncbi:zinc-binding alcohol dehydrogenase family protein [Chitinibacter fontanus]|uniref:Zinc-type alcohol dehydrogenase-like protein n=1 Tax=Chitinibacter fontanus TaxID=1737446 RepID=A0A7D5ZG91_9NEIS|nr:zinc-binding alcohol dehydrogenase family protein [Chitinibacter fontanus]QLI81267.1 zinc-binding alcohol dehydrogenase family protein [Chitinibacter fontanus]